MTQEIRLTVGLLFVGLTHIVTTHVAHAQTKPFPNSEITLIVPYAPNGTTDLAMRPVAAQVASILGVPVTIKNVPGETGALAPLQQLGAALPDGYSLSVLPHSVLQAPHAKRVQGNPLEDLTFIIRIGETEYGIATQASSSLRTWKDLINQARSNPRTIKYGINANSNSLRYAMMKVTSKESIEWSFVPFPGTAPTVLALLSGDVHAIVAPIAILNLFTKTGRMRVVATFSSARSQFYSDVPTLSELGYGLVVTDPFGVGGPKGMEPTTVKILHDAIKTAVGLSEQYPAYLGSEEYKQWATLHYQIEANNVAEYGWVP